MDVSWPEKVGEFKKLAVEEDPLCYLGILTDILQEWDRNTVTHECIIGGKLPIQGSEMILGSAVTTDGKKIGSKIVIDYKNSEISKKVKADLNYALKGWENIVGIVN